MGVRAVVVGVVTALCITALPGCLALELTTSVSGSGAFTGSMVTEFDRAAVAEFGVMDASQAEGTLAAASSSEGPVTVEWSETAEDYVQTVTFTAATSQQIEAATRGTGSDATGTTTTGVAFPLRATREGDRMVVSLVEDPRPRDAGSRDDVELARMLFGDSDVVVQVTMPGPIVDTEGVIVDAPRRVDVVRPDEDTFAVSATLADLAELENRAVRRTGLRVTSEIEVTTTSAPPQESIAPSASPTIADTSPPPPVLLLGAAATAAVVVVAVSVVLVRRRGR